MPPVAAGTALVALGLGGNLGPVAATLRSALDRLAEALGPLIVAPLYRTAPVSHIRQPDFLNTAAVGRTALSPEAVLGVAKRLERAAGRRRGERDGPRPLDIDLLTYGDLTASDPQLTLPHPRLTRRRFVLTPLADIAPDLPIPPEGRTVAQWLADLEDPSPVERVPWPTEESD